MAVILSLPIAGVGAYLGIAICGLENNIYFQIGLVMLVGLVAKNAILIVEFAKEETDKGIDAVQAALTAARLRFRPLVMTSLAFMLGLLPLVFATGPGSAARRDIGTGVFFGMLVAITVGIVFCSILLCTVLIRLRKNYRKMKARLLIYLFAAIMLGSCSGVKNCQKPQLDLPMSLAGNATDSIPLPIWVVEFLQRFHPGRPYSRGFGA